MKLTQGQWDTISPDYKRIVDGQKKVLSVNDDMSTHLEDVEIVDIPPIVCIPEHYRHWPSDPRD